MSCALKCCLHIQYWHDCNRTSAGLLGLNQWTSEENSSQQKYFVSLLRKVTVNEVLKYFLNITITVFLAHHCFIILATYLYGFLNGCHHFAELELQLLHLFIIKIVQRSTWNKSKKLVTTNTLYQGLHHIVVKLVKTESTITNTNHLKQNKCHTP